RRPQMRHAPAQNELLDLREELDLADAASPELHVEVRRRQLGVPAMRVNLALDGMDVCYRPNIEMPAPDIGLELFKIRPACSLIARTDACLDMGHALPVLADALIISCRELGGDRRAGGGGVGPQAQISPEDIAVSGSFLEYFDQIAREA